MVKLKTIDVVIIIICFLVWLGTSISMFFIHHWSVLFVALLHCASIWFSFSKYGKYIPTKPKKTQAELEKELSECVAKNIKTTYEIEWIKWDMFI